MTDRVQAFVVTLDRDIRVDDVEQIKTALAMVKHVVDVSPVVATSDDHIARERVRNEVEVALYKAIRKIFGRDDI